MAKKVEISVEEKLRALFDLQLIDSRIDQIRSIRGELPLEVEDLENEIEGLKKRLEGFESEIQESHDGIKFEENSITTSKENHKKYEGDLKKVRNNREYNAIVKEQEFQELEIKLSEKKIAQYKDTVENKTVVKDELKQKIKDRSAHLKSKNSELGEILKETEKEEKTLLLKSKEFEKKVNSESVLWQTIETEYWKNFLRELILEHLNETNSKVSKLIIDNFNEEVKNFIQVCPKEMIDKIENPITLKSNVKDVS